MSRKPEQRPVIIIGTGPAGMCVADELTRIAPEQQIIMFGGEPWRPYDRIQLTSLLAGDVRLADMNYEDGFASSTAKVVQYRNQPIRAIDPYGRYVTDSEGHEYRYSKLVLATGSTPRSLDIAGVDLPGVFTFRNLDDAMQLMARQVTSRRTVVIGGGLLGLEAARAMQRHNTQVWVVERENRLLPRQLDEDAAGFFSEYVLAAGINVSLNTTVAAIEGRDRVRRVWLEDGCEISCDTVVIAVGIEPNVELARHAGLEVGRGIRIQDDTRTSDPNIFAVGECAEHNGKVYGRVAPGQEQARVAAHTIAGNAATYVGTVAATKLNLFGVDLYSLGKVQKLGAEERPYIWRSSKDNIYRKLVVRDGRAVGVISVGNWPALPRVQDFVNQQRKFMRKHAECFQRTGFIWSPEGQPEVIHWPDSAVVCHCTGMTRGELGRVIRKGTRSLEAVARETRAGSVCNSCEPLISELQQDMAARPLGRKMLELFSR